MFRGSVDLLPVNVAVMPLPDGPLERMEVPRGSGEHRGAARGRVPRRNRCEFEMTVMYSMPRRRGREAGKMGREKLAGFERLDGTGSG